MDPDPNGLYTKRKQQRIGIGAISSVTDSSHGDANKPSVKYPTDGWSTSLEKMPMFIRACSVFCFYRFFYRFNFGKENSACCADLFAIGGSFPLARRGASPRKQRWNGIRSQISPTAESLDKVVLSKMP